jgi:predicted NBD/HSP70 family sugar kinase
MAGFVIAADVGGSKLLMRACDQHGVVHGEERHATGPATDGANLDALLGRFVAAYPGAKSVAVGVPGLVDSQGQVVVSDVLPRLAGWSPAQTSIGPGVVVVNDVRASLAAVRLAEPDLRELVVVVVGTGIAAAVLAGGEVLSGASGWAGELGSVPVDLAGHSGQLLDDIASGRSIERALGLPGREVARLVSAGDPTAVKIVSAAGSALGRALGGLVTLLNPSRLVLGGGTTRYPGYVDAAYAAATETALTEAWAGCRVTTDEDPGTLVIRGLAALAFDADAPTS